MTTTGFELAITVTKRPQTAW